MSIHTKLAFGVAVLLSFAVSMVVFMGTALELTGTQIAMVQDAAAGAYVAAAWTLISYIADYFFSPRA